MSAYNNKDLYSVLSSLHVINDELLDTSLKESEETNALLGDVLYGKDLINEQNLGKIVADLISVPFINLNEVSISNDILQIVPEHVAKTQNIIAFKKDDVELSVATSDPSNTQIINFLSKKTNLKIKVFYTLQNILENSFNLYSKNIANAFDEIIKENVEAVKLDKSLEPPIIKIVDTIINYAYQNKASDIHIEPLIKGTLVRFRIDGVLHDMITLPLELSNQIVTRIKVMANLRTDEHQVAQDGKISFSTDSTLGVAENLDLRVSIAPITRGETIVMRLLSEKSRQFSLSDLGLNGDDLKKVTDAYHLPHGMILSTGPTGSGKSTTLYAILKLINKREINIMTIEDPVEYQIDNINQIQVNSKTDLTFAKGLRSIVRQDPDVILVGEIRDNETADIAINSAMTGHLVLSTLHTNDAVTAFPRLMDMGVEPYLIASTVNVVVAQRLVRKICVKCRVSTEITYAGNRMHCYVGKGCSVCHNSGYSGRVGIFEVLVMNDELNQAVTNKLNSEELRKIAIKSGMRTMLEDGILKVKQGITTIDEVLRVTTE